SAPFAIAQDFDDAMLVDWKTKRRLDDSAQVGRHVAGGKTSAPDTQFCCTGAPRSIPPIFEARTLIFGEILLRRRPPPPEVPGYRRDSPPRATTLPVRPPL